MSSGEASSSHETAQEFYIERTNFVSIPLTGVLYGIHLMLFAHVLHALSSGKPWRKVPFGLIAYIGALFAFATCYFGSIIKWAQDMWIDYRDSPGGPIGFYYDDPSDSYLCIPEQPGRCVALESIPEQPFDAP